LRRSARRQRSRRVHLLALEAGEYDALPGGVFRKGIVRSYVAALGLDEVSWIERFEASLRDSGGASPEAKDWTEFAENVRRKQGGGRVSDGPPMDGRGDDGGIAGGAGLERVEVCAAWTADSVNTL